QYFPSVDYLLRVLEGAVKAVRDGGCVWVGDVRSLPLLEALHTSVQLHRAGPALTRSQLRRRVERAEAQEKELLLDPAFFQVLSGHIARLGGSEVRLKRGRPHNELTRFRYDAILHVGPARPRAAAALEMDCEQEPMSLESLRLQLQTCPESVCLRRVPNARLARESSALRWLAGDEGAATVGGLREALASARPDGWDPEDLLALGSELSYTVEVLPTADREGRYDVLLAQPSSRQDAGTAAERPAVPAPSPALWAAYANEPWQGVLDRQLLPRLRVAVNAALPSYMAPSAFVVMEALPVTPNGKVDRRALPAPEMERPELATDYEAPRTAVEQVLAEIWSGVLGLERLGIHDNFFELGGHSLLATQVVSRVRESFGVELPLRRLFEAPTLEGLARVVDGLRSGDLAVPPLRTVPREGDLPLSFAQERLWFLDQLQPDSSAYNMSTAVQLSGRLDVAALAATLREIVRRHESLRTAFSLRSGQPAQTISPAVELPLPIVDLGSLEPGRQDATLRALANSESLRPFDLRRAPLLRALLVRSRGDEHALLLTVHHIASDAWSMGLLVQEMVTLYRAFSQGEASPLPELPVQYADFAVWQRGWLQGEVLAAQLAYWRSQLAELPILQLATDRPRKALKIHRGANAPFRLPVAVSEGVRSLSRQLGATPFMVLLAGFEMLLHRYTGQDDLIVGSTIANRTHSELERLIGFFVNTLALRADLAGDPAFSALLVRVRESALGAYAHQDLPFEKLVAEL
ncbi:MAG TPA: condensation domain-containing protein, partial [Thermoanaerobaculia bacterium]|nr:condensation domain-containing protein [Thermoanaerobaculia bacterium]